MAFQFSEDPSESMSDAAVEKLLQGDVMGAVQDLEAAEKAHPGHYYTAANLGTAYELAGDDEKALQWILEGIKRDPKAHMRTEWLHARILNAKLKVKSDPAWLEHNSISEVNFPDVNKSEYRVSTLQGNLDAAAIHKTLWTQLSVRMLFVKPKDPIVAQLLYELALVEAHTKVLEEATVYLKIAERYGLPPEKAEPLLKKWKSIIWLSTNAWIILSVLGLLLILLGIIWIRKRSKRRAASPGRLEVSA